jgi:hypothetical protein
MRFSRPLRLRSGRALRDGFGFLPLHPALKRRATIKRPPTLLGPPGHPRAQQKGFFKKASSAFVLRRPSAWFLSGKRPKRTI